MQNALRLALVLLLVAAAAAFVGWGDYATDTDVRAIYAATWAVADGHSPYDEGYQSVLMSGLTGEERHVLPLGYLPWYVLTCLPLGWLPYGMAERLFLVMNVSWLMVAIVALTQDRDGPQAAIAAVLAVAYVPTLGLIAVGQMAMPVLAGIALGILGYDRRSPWLLALSAFLMSYKWHIGGIPALGGLVLMLREPALFKRTLLPLAVLFGSGTLLGLVLDPRWPLEYVRSVRTLATADVNLLCDTCSSVAWTASSRLGVKTSMIGLPLLVGGTAAIGWRRLVREPRAFMAAVTALALVCLPYVRNYDNAILSISLIVAMERATALWQRGVVLACWATAFMIAAIPRVYADEVLGSTALVVLVLLLVQPLVEDAPADPARSPT